MSGGHGNREGDVSLMSGRPNELDELSADGVDVIVLGSEARGSTKRRPHGLVGEHGVDGFGECGDIPRRHEHATSAVLHHFVDPRQSRADDRTAGGHGVEKDDRNSVLVPRRCGNRRDDEHLRFMHRPAEIFAAKLSEKPDRQTLGSSFQPVAQRTIADDVERPGACSKLTDRFEQDLDALFLDHPPRYEDAPADDADIVSRGPDQPHVGPRREDMGPISRSTELEEPCSHLAIHGRYGSGSYQDRPMNAVPEPPSQRVDVSPQGGKDHRHTARGGDRNDPLRDDPMCVDDIGTKCPHGATYCEGLRAEQSRNLNEVRSIRANVFDDRAARNPFPTLREIRETFDAQTPVALLDHWRVRYPGSKDERLEVACLILGEIAHESGRSVALERRKGRRYYE
jgi:hypothetical protein